MKSERFKTVRKIWESRGKSPVCGLFVAVSIRNEQEGEASAEIFFKHVWFSGWIKKKLPEGSFFEVKRKGSNGGLMSAAILPGLLPAG